MNQSVFLSVIVPSYNEQKNIRRGVLDQILKYLNTQKYEWELIFSDDGSTDGTAEVLDTFATKDKRVKVLHNIHAGKGPTVQSGMLKAAGQWRLFTDFDQSTPLKEVEQLLSYQGEYDIMIGSREIQGAKRDQEPWYRHLMGRGFNFLVQLLAVPGIQDTQCGFKLFSAETAQQLFSNLVIYGRHQERSDAYTGAFDVEALYLANKHHYRIKEVPVLWKHHETNRVSPIKDSLRMLFDILKIRWADLTGKYKKL